jgi:methylase of polypeptide subunit release factors
MKDYITKDDIVIDATMGHGHDTVYLAQYAKEIIAFDIQPIALESTRKKLEERNITNVKLILDSHENVMNYVDSFKGVLFNLGYLPLTDKTITTKKESTLISVKSLINHIPRDGFILLTVYPNHQAGYEESVALTEYFQTLDHLIFKVIKIDLPFLDNYPPYIYFITKV